MYNVRSSQSGQTLVEILMVLAILIVVIFGLIVSVNFGLQTGDVSKNRTLAIHYATEAIEFMRATKISGWNQLPGMPTGVDTPILQTPFTRKIEVWDKDDTAFFPADDNEMKARVTVKWQDGPQLYSVTLNTLLTNWQ